MKYWQAVQLLRIYKTPIRRQGWKDLDKRIVVRGAALTEANSNCWWDPTSEDEKADDWMAYLDIRT